MEGTFFLRERKKFPKYISDKERERDGVANHSLCGQVCCIQLYTIFVLRGAPVCMRGGRVQEEVHQERGADPPQTDPLRGQTLPLPGAGTKSAVYLGLQYILALYPNICL